MTSAASIVQLQLGDSQVTLCPEIGGAIGRFTWKGHDILRRAPDSAINEKQVRQMGVYPLMPYSNRIGQAKLIVGDQTFALRPNFLQEPHAIHGFGWQRVWEIEKRSTDSALLRLAHTPDADWPFACEATESVRLTENTLHIALTVKNNDKRAMPAGLGFHPYFPIAPGTHLQSDWKGMWKMGADSLPTELGPVPMEADFSQLRPLAGWKVDHCFTGWARRALLDYPTHRMQLDASAVCRNIVVFAPNDGRNFIALEPVTHINNAFALAANGVADTGMRMLATGESFEASMSIAVSGRAARDIGNI
ncbi:MAG: aldose 1-epimerase [Usitatibacteraceae bacterium]